VLHRHSFQQLSADICFLSAAKVAAAKAKQQRYKNDNNILFCQSTKTTTIFSFANLQKRHQYSLLPIYKNDTNILFCQSTTASNFDAAPHHVSDKGLSKGSRLSPETGFSK
jgi:hypothetical protein